MASVNDLKEYLIGSTNSYLIDDSHNGKTSMLSGEWGSGKTFFWQNEIVPRLNRELKKKNKACVYVSLYGKNNLEAIKNEILYKSYATFSNDKSELAQENSIAAFGLGSRILGSLSVAGIGVNTAAIVDALAAANEGKKLIEGEQYISDGGVICLDDFERKSKDIDLNDLFGFISQLSIEMSCKVVIILNSDIFHGEEKNVFKNVKEKSVNKYFSFTPSIEELFDVIFNNKKYNSLSSHRTTILEVIKETKELNARIYIQVLDNCLEWLTKFPRDKGALRALILATINFVKNHFVFDKTILCEGTGEETYSICVSEEFINYIEIVNFLIQRMPKSRGGLENLLHIMRSTVNRNKDKDKKSEEYYRSLNIIFENNIELFKAIYFYGYYLKLEDGF